MCFVLCRCHRKLNYLLEKKMTALTGIAFCFFVAWQAYNKGYNPVFWFLAAGPIGYFILLFLPDLKKSQLPVEFTEKPEQVAESGAFPDHNAFHLEKFRQVLVVGRLVAVHLAQ